jgi:hypothetical protein
MPETSWAALVRTWFQIWTTSRRVDVYDAGWIDFSDLRGVAAGHSLRGAVGVLVSVKDIAWVETIHDCQEHSKIKVSAIGPVVDTVGRSVGEWTLSIILSLTARIFASLLRAGLIVRLVRWVGACCGGIAGRDRWMFAINFWPRPLGVYGQFLEDRLFQVNAHHTGQL